MRDPILNARGTQRGAGSAMGRSGNFVQKPLPRHGRTGDRNDNGVIRRILSAVPTAAMVFLFLLVGTLLVVGYRAAASASFFQLRTIDVAGSSRVPEDEIKTIVRRTINGHGVWKADVTAISNELSKLGWVRRAVVSRVLPDGIRVRITDREPVAVVRLVSGKLVWVDDDAVTLGGMTSSDKLPPFFVRGWDETGTAEARKQNLVRVQKYHEIERVFESLGLTPRVSEVDLADLRAVNVMLNGDDSDVEIRLGREDFANRLRGSLEQLDRIHQSRADFVVISIDASNGSKSGDKNQYVIGRAVKSVQTETGMKDPSSETAGSGNPVQTRSQNGAAVTQNAPATTNSGAGQPASKSNKENKPKTTNNRKPARPSRAG